MPNAPGTAGPDKGDAPSSWTRRKRAPVVPGAELDALLIAILGESRFPLSAYELADHLHEQGRHIAMPSIYRSLERLSLRCAIEKVQTLSAFRLRDQPGAILLICERCGRTEAMPVPDAHDAITGRIAEAGFAITTVSFEVSGTCLDCTGTV